MLWFHNKHHVNYIREMTTVLSRDGFEFAFRNLFKKTTHVFCLEWQLQACHFVSDTCHAPHIRFEIIGFVFPNLWTSVVWRPSLCVVETILSCNSRNIQITNFNYVFVCQKNIRALKSVIISKFIPLSLCA